MVNLSRRHALVRLAAKFAAFLLVGISIWSVGKNSFYFIKEPRRYSVPIAEAMRRNFLSVGREVNYFLPVGPLCTKSNFAYDGRLIKDCAIVYADEDCFLVVFGFRCGSVIADATLIEVPGVIERVNSSKNNLCANMPAQGHPLKGSFRFIIDSLECHRRFSWKKAIVVIKYRR